jgi:excisionase family DNA binding protein
MIAAKQTTQNNLHVDVGERLTPLLITPRQASAMLSISERTLWTLTKKGDIPVIRIGRAIRYALRDLEGWIEDKKQRGQTDLRVDKNCV